MILNSDEWEYLLNNGYLNTKGIEAYNNQLRKELNDLEYEIDYNRQRNNHLENYIKKLKEQN